PPVPYTTLFRSDRVAEVKNTAQKTRDQNQRDELCGDGYLAHQLARKFAEKSFSVVAFRGRRCIECGFFDKRGDVRLIPRGCDQRWFFGERKERERDISAFDPQDIAVGNGNEPAKRFVIYRERKFRVEFCDAENSVAVLEFEPAAG